MASKATSCAQCGKQGEVKRCLRCKQVSYCGAECQKAGWKGHKVTCMTLDDIVGQVWAAHNNSDWSGVLAWEGRLEELLDEAREFADQPESACHNILEMFANAHEIQYLSYGRSVHHRKEALKLNKRKIDLLGTMQRFRDQGDAMCSIAALSEDEDEQARYYHMARDLGAEHGFFALECRSLNPKPLTLTTYPRPLNPKT